MYKKFQSLSFLTPLVAGLLFANVGNAQTLNTQSILPDNKQESFLAPNLTVNFKLNSTLGAKETAYYSKIVEKILASLPTEITLTGEESNLLAGSGKYDTLKVIAYLPASDEEVADNPLNKKIEQFNIRFELPKEKRLERLSRSEGGEQILVEQKQSLKDFLGEEASMESKAQEELPENAKIAEKEVKPKVEPKLNKKVAVASKVPVKTLAPQKIKLKYFDDSLLFISDQNDTLKNFAQKMKQGQIKKLKVITQTASSPFTSWEEVRQQRMAKLKETLKGFGVNVGDVEFSAIHLQTALHQSILLEL